MREYADGYKKSDFGVDGIVKLLYQAVDTIEALSEKLAAANTERSESYYNDGWIYCGDGKNTPEKTGFYMVTKEIRETGERFTGKGHFDTKKGWNDHLNFVDVVAWQSLLLKYKGRSAESGDSD